jgi:hypothetical protein
VQQRAPHTIELEQPTHPPDSDHQHTTRAAPGTRDSCPHAPPCRPPCRPPHSVPITSSSRMEEETEETAPAMATRWGVGLVGGLLRAVGAWELAGRETGAV